MSATRLRYDSLIPYFYATHREELIPENIRTTIPEPNKSRWRKSAPEKFVHEVFRSELERLASAAELNRQIKYFRSALYGMARIAVQMKPFIRNAVIRELENRETKSMIVAAK